MPWWTELSAQERSEQLLDDLRTAEALAATLPRHSRDREMIETTITDLVRELGAIAEGSGAPSGPDRAASPHEGS